MKYFLLKRWIGNTNGFIFSVYAIVAAFSTYSCMYAFRKPFAVATFEGQMFFGVDYKILLITAQLAGYSLSKFIGIKIVSELSFSKRALGILIMIGIAESGLFLFALVKPPFNILAMFLNGLPLGIIWGLVFSYLEGRRFTELLGAGLSVSFIISSGFVKSVGKITMVYWGVSEFWMPFITGSLFIIPLLISVWLLDQLPPPDTKDKKLRTERAPMNREQRWAYFKSFSFGIILLISVYALLTAMRDYRDNFVADIWNEVGYGNSTGIYTFTEIPVTLGILVIMGMMFLIRKNIRALMMNHLIILTGLIILGLSGYLYKTENINAPSWMIMSGLGLYMSYIPFNSILFDRLIAVFKYIGTAGFLIYLADSFGYLSSIGILIYSNYFQSDISPQNFFLNTSHHLVIIGVILTLMSMIYFYWKYKTWNVKMGIRSV